MSPNPKISMPSASAQFWEFLSVLIVAILVLFIFRLYVATQRPLTPFEGTISDLFFFFLTIALTWLLAKRDEERNILANQKALAKSALRRVTGIGENAEGILDNLRQTAKEIDSDSFWLDIDEPRRRLLLEVLNGLSRQVLELRSTIDASAEDWGEILPDELAKIRSAQQQILKQREAEIRAIASEVEELEKRVQEGQLEKEELRELIETKVANIENQTRIEIERIRSENRPFGLLDLSAPAASGAVSPFTITTPTLSSRSPFSLIAHSLLGGGLKMAPGPKLEKPDSPVALKVPPAPALKDPKKE